MGSEILYARAVSLNPLMHIFWFPGEELSLLLSAHGGSHVRQKEKGGQHVHIGRNDMANASFRFPFFISSIHEQITSLIQSWV